MLFEPNLSLEYVSKNHRVFFLILASVVSAPGGSLGIKRKKASLNGNQNMKKTWLEERRGRESSEHQIRI